MPNRTPRATPHAKPAPCRSSRPAIRSLRPPPSGRTASGVDAGAPSMGEHRDHHQAHVIRHHEITTLHQRPRTGHRRHVEAASRRHSEPHALRVTDRRGQRHYRELNHLAGARQHTGKRVDDVPMTAADMAGVSIAMSSSAPPLLSIPVARTTPVGSADSPRQRVRLLCGVPYGAGQFGDLAWGHG